MMQNDEIQGPPRILKILVADDNVDNADSLGTLLGAWGH